MKKYFNRLLSLVIATVIILTFSAVPAFATGSDPYTWTPTSPDADNTMQTIRANYIEGSGVDVYAYQIVRGRYKDGKLTGYELCDSVNAPIANISAPTSNEITTIANNIQSGKANLASVQMRKTGPAAFPIYKATVEAGEYIILVSKSTGGYIYNPGVVAVNVSDANNIDTSSSGGRVSMESQFSAGDTAYIKSSSVGSIRKKIVGVIGDPVNTASYGDTVNFIIENISIPIYSQDYQSVQYTITDDLYLDHSADPPFLGVSALTVKVGDTSQLTDEDEVTSGANTYTVTYYDEDGAVTNDATEAVKYKIEFADAFIRANGTKNVEVTYSTTLTDDAKLAVSDYSHDFVSNDTRATLRYSNDPTYVPPEDDPNSVPPYQEFSSRETHTFTFGIDSGNSSVQTYELNKVTQAGGTYTSVLDNNDAEITKKSPYALAGATFTIYSDRAMTDVIESAGTATTPPNGTSISDANGHIEFRGLGEGTYYIKETAAPSGYTLNENNYKIVISPTFSGEALALYTISTYLMGTTDTQIGSATYTNSGSAITSTVTPAEIVNTTLATLPTTGGVGTIVISIVAGLGMAVFLTIFIISKKRSSKKLK